MFLKRALVNELTKLSILSHSNYSKYFPRKNDISKNNPDIEYSYLTIAQSVNVSRKS